MPLSPNSDTLFFSPSLLHDEGSLRNFEGTLFRLIAWRKVEETLDKLATDIPPMKPEA